MPRLAQHANCIVCRRNCTRPIARSQLSHHHAELGTGKTTDCDVRISRKHSASRARIPFPELCPNPPLLGAIGRNGEFVPPQGFFSKSSNLIFCTDRKICHKNAICTVGYTWFGFSLQYEIDSIPPYVRRSFPTEQAGEPHGIRPNTGSHAES